MDVIEIQYKRRDHEILLKFTIKSRIAENEQHEDRGGMMLVSCRFSYDG